MSNKKRDWSLKDRIVGEELNAIQFIMDYLQVFFNDKSFIFYVWPDLNINNQVYKYGDIEYRNELCKLIERVVKEVYIFENDLLVIEFDKGERIMLNLDPNNPDIVGEIAVFWDNDSNWAVFD